MITGILPGVGACNMLQAGEEMRENESLFELMA
jgi:hypothetical protein